MRQAQFDQVLEWTMLNALYGAELLMQSRKGRQLTQEEVLKCHRDAHVVADEIRMMFAENRKPERKSGISAGG